jgi:hypothetical protein
MSSSAKTDDPVFRDISDQSPASFGVTNFETRSPGKAVSHPGMEHEAVG